MKVITFDLDNTIFDNTPVIFEAFKRHNMKPYIGDDYDVKKAYPKCISDECYKLFLEDIWYNTKFITPNTDTYINFINAHPLFNVYYVSNRGREAIHTLNQLHTNNIHCNVKQIVHVGQSKVETLKQLKTDMHYDDSPYVIVDCIKNNIPVHMISNDKTPYNYHLRKDVGYSENIVEAIKKTLKQYYGR